MKEYREPNRELQKPPRSRSLLTLLGGAFAALIATLSLLFQGAGTKALVPENKLDISELWHNISKLLHIVPEITQASRAPYGPLIVKAPPARNSEILLTQNVSSIYVSYGGESPENPRMADYLTDKLRSAKFSIAPDPGPNVLTLLVSVSDLSAPSPSENATIDLFKATAKVRVEATIGTDVANKSTFDVTASAKKGREEVQDGALQKAAESIIEKLRE